ncbi:hypothetical protein D3C83_128680 [compost metagenome]
MRSPNHDWSLSRLRPAIVRPGRTSRNSGSGCSESQETPPPVLATTGISRSSVARTSAISIGFSAPEAASVECLASEMR